MDELDKILSNYISHHNKKFDFYFFNCEFEKEFGNNFTAIVEINYHYNRNFKYEKSSLLCYIDSFKSGRYKFSNINHLTINTINCMCNMTYEHYKNKPTHSVERRINMISAKNPQLINALDRNKPHPLINKYSHIPFNN